ncbi:MAG: PTS transporter subunit IIC [Anaerolineales bacterium]
MEAILAGIKSLFDTLGATVMLPIIIFIIAVILGAKPGRAFRAAVTIGVAFVGINLVIGLLWNTLTEVAQAIVTNTGIQRDVVDVGWPSAAAIAFGSSVGLWVIPIALIVNILLLVTRLTRTLNVDVWNFWHFAFIGSLVVALTGNLGYGLIAAAVAAALALFFADWTAKAVQSFYKLPGISIPHLTSAPIVPIAIVVNWIIDRIPGLKDIDINTDTIQKRFGVFGEPVILGLVIGLVLGLIGFYNVEGGFFAILGKVLGTGISLAAVMLLLPRMVSILMEGLIPVAEAAREFMQKRAAGREINIGLDSAILIGHPAAISSSLLLVPLAILLSVILPGNRVILFADLAVIPFVVAMTAPVLRGNVFRMVVAGIITLSLGFYIATAMAPLFTQAAVAAGFALPEGAVQITSIADGFLWTPYVFVQLTGLLGVIGIVLILALVGAAIFLFNRNQRAWEIAAGAPAESVSAD